MYTINIQLFRISISKTFCRNLQKTTSSWLEASSWNVNYYYFLIDKLGNTELVVFKFLRFPDFWNRIVETDFFPEIVFFILSVFNNNISILSFLIVFKLYFDAKLSSGRWVMFTLLYLYNHWNKFHIIIWPWIRL